MLGNGGYLGVNASLGKVRQRCYFTGNRQAATSRHGTDSATSTRPGARSWGLTYLRGTIPESGKTSPSERLEKLTPPDCYESEGLRRSQTEDTNGGRGLGDQICLLLWGTDRIAKRPRPRLRV